MLIYFFAVLVILFILSIYYFNYMGALNPIEIKEKRLPRSLILYCEYVGEYKKIGSVFKNVGQNVMPHFEPGPDKMVGIYYDDPNLVEDRRYSRAVVGVLIGDHERAKAEEFIVSHPIFKLKELPEADCVYGVFPYRSRMSILLMIIKVYPKVKEYALHRRIMREPGDFSAMLEIYDMHPDAKVEVILPYGNTSQGFCLSTQPAPQLLKDDSKKGR